MGPRIQFVARGGAHLELLPELLPELCGAISDRALEGKLHPTQQRLVPRIAERDARDRQRQLRTVGR